MEEVSSNPAEKEALAAKWVRRKYDSKWGEVVIRNAFALRWCYLSTAEQSALHCREDLASRGPLLSWSDRLL